MKIKFKVDYQTCFLCSETESCNEDPTYGDLEAYNKDLIHSGTASYNSDFLFKANKEYLIERIIEYRIREDRINEERFSLVWLVDEDDGAIDAITLETFNNKNICEIIDEK